MSRNVVRPLPWAKVFWLGSLNPLHVAERRQTLHAGELPVHLRLNPLHVAERRQTIACDWSAIMVKRVSIRCMSRSVVRPSGLQHSSLHSRVSIRCTSRSIVRPMDWGSPWPLLSQSAARRGASSDVYYPLTSTASESLNPLHVAEHRQTLLSWASPRWWPGLNPLHVAEHRQTYLAEHLADERVVSIRCTSRSIVRPSYHQPVTTKESQSAARRGASSDRRLEAMHDAMAVSIRCTSRSIVRPTSTSKTFRERLNPLHVAEHRQTVGLKPLRQQGLARILSSILDHIAVP